VSAKSRQAFRSNLFCREAKQKGFPLQSFTRVSLNIQAVFTKGQIAASAIAAKILCAVLLRRNCSGKRARTPEKSIEQMYTPLRKHSTIRKNYWFLEKVNDFTFRSMFP